MAPGCSELGGIGPPVGEQEASALQPWCGQRSPDRAGTLTDHRGEQEPPTPAAARAAPQLGLPPGPQSSPQPPPFILLSSGPAVCPGPVGARCYLGPGPLATSLTPHAPASSQQPAAIFQRLPRQRGPPSVPAAPRARSLRQARERRGPPLGAAPRSPTEPVSAADRPLPPRWAPRRPRPPQL